jgi:hypothetical protein
MRLITRFNSLDTSSMLLKRFPRSGFFNFGKRSKSGGLMSGLYGGWGSTCHPYFSKISDTEPEAWGRALSLSDSSQFFLPFQRSVLQNRDHVACQYAHSVLYRSLAHNCRENQKDCINLLAAQAQCAELLRWPTYIIVNIIIFFEPLWLSLPIGWLFFTQCWSVLMLHRAFICLVITLDTTVNDVRMWNFFLAQKRSVTAAD